jgi:hypothetical protein
MLTQQPKRQLQSEHECKKQTHSKYKDKTIYNIRVKMMVIKIIIIIKIKGKKQTNNIQKGIYIICIIIIIITVIILIIAIIQI